MKSVALRVLYHSDAHRLDEVRLHAIAYLINNELELHYPFVKSANNGMPTEIQCDDLDYAVEELRNLGFMDVDRNQTFGGEERDILYLTEKGVSRIESLISDSDNEETIERITEENHDYPVSNLLQDIHDSEPAHEWN